MWKTQTHENIRGHRKWRKKKKPSQMWAPPLLPLPFFPKPWWCVMFLGDNRCHGENTLVSALWGTLHTHTHTHIWSTNSSFSAPWEPLMTLFFLFSLTSTFHFFLILFGIILQRSHQMLFCLLKFVFLFVFFGCHST